MEYLANSRTTQIYLALDGIEQVPYESPSVFNYYTPTHQPSGVIGDSGLVSPEAQLLSTPSSIAYLNGMYALTKDGLGPCNLGFGFQVRPNAENVGGQSQGFPAAPGWPGGCGDWGWYGDGHGGSEIFIPEHPTATQVHGALSFVPAARDTSSSAAVAELDLLLTGGRLSARNKDHIEDAYEAITSWGMGDAWPGVDAGGHHLVSPAALQNGLNGNTRYNGDNARCALDNASHPTACCSDTEQAGFGLPYARGGWGYNGKHTAHGGFFFPHWLASQGRPQVYARTNGCFQGTYSEALAHCSGMGGRLCTSAEANHGVMANAGWPAHLRCPADSYLWTQDPCHDKSAQATKKATTMIIATAEYNTETAGSEIQNSTRVQGLDIPFQSRDYKAVVLIYANGGMDSYNMLVPHSNCPTKDMYAEYAEARGIVALNLNQLLPIAVPDLGWGTQPCSTFGLHHKMNRIKALYEDGDAMFIANIGTLIGPLTPESYRSNTGEIPAEIGSHDGQKQQSNTVHAQRKGASGILGKLVSALRSQPNPYRAFPYGFTGVGSMIAAKGPASVLKLSRDGGLPDFQDLDTVRDSLNHMSSRKYSNVFSETFAANIESVVYQLGLLKPLLDDAEGNLLSSWPFGRREQSLEKQLKQTAKVITMRNAPGIQSERDFFIVQTGGYDSHFSTHDVMEKGLEDYDISINIFADEMKAQGIWDSVTIVTVSEFGRTLSTNGYGTDHGWGGNQMIIGGAVAGGQILGTYPDELLPSATGNYYLGRGRIIPSTPWEGIWYGIAQWLGVDNDQMSDVLPNMEKFRVGETLFTLPQMFGCGGNGIPCSTDCIGMWPLEWTECTQACGGGTQTRSFNITSPSLHGGRCLLGGTHELQACNSDVCPVPAGSINASLVLDADFTEIGADQLQESYTSFVAEFQSDVAAELGIAADQVVLNSIEACSFGFQASSGNGRAFVLEEIVGATVCASGQPSVPQEECLAAVTSLLPEGTTAARAHLSTGAWPWMVAGCTVQSGSWDAHYNTAVASTAGSSTQFTLVCAQPPRPTLPACLSGASELDSSPPTHPPGYASIGLGDHVGELVHGEPITISYTGASICDTNASAAPSVNHALGRPTSQSITVAGGSSNRAVDGDTNANFNGGSCTHTLNRATDWFQVDLGSVQPISQVLIYHRSSSVERLVGASVIVSDTPDFSAGNVCGTLQLEPVSTVDCGQPGQYVTVAHLHEPYNFLSICEIEVMGPVSGRPGYDCTTSGGNAPEHSQCVFPFIFQGEVYNQCTDVGHEQQWCYHNQDANTWGNCNCAVNHNPALAGSDGPALCSWHDWVGMYSVDACCSYDQLTYVETAHWGYHGAGGTAAGSGSVTLVPEQVGSYYVMLLGGSDGYTELSDPLNRLMVTVTETGESIKVGFTVTPDQSTGQVVAPAQLSAAFQRTWITIAGASTLIPVIVEVVDLWETPPVGVPVNCTGNWTSWTACSLPCGGGTQMQSFAVMAPARQGGVCSDQGAHANQECNPQSCPVDCVGEWGSWSACPVSCGSGVQMRSYAVATAASFGGMCAQAGTVEHQDCNTNPCPLDCVGQFTAWTTCTVPCGGGEQNRTFNVSTPALNGGSCPHENAEQVQGCNIVACPIDCVGSWSDFSLCSHPCGDAGVQSRTYSVTTAAAHGGADCTSTLAGDVDTQTCNADIFCPIDCVGSWSNLTPCTHLCGDAGTQTRTYSLTIAAAHGGVDCGGALDADVDTQSCITGLVCPPPTVWTATATYHAIGIASIAVGSPERAAFESSFVTAVATVMGADIEESMVAITSITGGGSIIIVAFAVSAPAYVATGVTETFVYLAADASSLTVAGATATVMAATATTVTFCPDLTGDGVVSTNDLLYLLAAWGDTASPADFNGDGIVGTDDLLIVLSAYGDTC